MPLQPPITLQGAEVAVASHVMTNFHDIYLELNNLGGRGGYGYKSITGSHIGNNTITKENVDGSIFTTDTANTKIAHLDYIPELRNITFTAELNVDVYRIAWTDGYVTFAGRVFYIEAGYGTDEYWYAYIDTDIDVVNGAEPTIETTAVPTIVSGRFYVAYLHNPGSGYEVSRSLQSTIIHGGLIQAGTITASNIVADSITLSLIDETSINLGTIGGSLDDIDPGITFGKVLTASLTAGGLVLWSQINDDDGNQPADNADVTATEFPSVLPDYIVRAAGGAPPEHSAGKLWYCTADGGTYKQGRLYRSTGAAWELNDDALHATTITAGQIALTSLTGQIDADTQITAGTIVVAKFNADATGRMFTSTTEQTNMEAWIADTVTEIDGGKIYAGSAITVGSAALSGSITIRGAADQGDAMIRSNIGGSVTDFGLTNPGFIMGMDDSDSDKYKFEIGDATHNLKWNGTNLTVDGSAIGTSTITGIQAGTEIAIQGWQSTLVFTASDYRTVTWSAGSDETITLLDGTVYTIASGTTGAMAALTYIYLDIGTSTTVLQTTTTAATAVGTGKILITVAKNNTDTASDATLQAFGGSGGLILSTDNIATNAITANEIAANTITANEIAANTITANEIAASTITSNEIASYNITAANATLENLVVKTAHIDNLSVSTGKIEADAINNITYAQSAGAGIISRPYLAMAGITHTQVQENAPILITASVELENTTSATNYNCTFKVVQLVTLHGTDTGNTLTSAANNDIVLDMSLYSAINDLVDLVFWQTGEGVHAAEFVKQGGTTIRIEAEWVDEASDGTGLTLAFYTISGVFADISQTWRQKILSDGGAVVTRMYIGSSAGSGDITLMFLARNVGSSASTFYTNAQSATLIAQEVKK